jgi:anti-sigma-K factor RskA
MSSSDGHAECPVHPLIASYALGILDPSDRRLVAAHLPECAACRAALGEVAPLPGLLARVSAEDAAAGPPVPSAAILARLVDAALAERSARRRRLVSLAAAASIALAAGAGVAVVRATGGEPPGYTVAAAQGTVHASVRLTAISGGTALRLTLSGVAPEQTCRLVAIAPDGHREVAASWTASYSGTAHIRGSAALPPTRITSLVVETFDDQTLVTLPAPAGSEPGR